jgi:hypothetical protein
MGQCHHRAVRSLSLGTVLFAAISGMCLFTFHADAQASSRAKNKADEWIGRDASDLLLQLRVDGGRVDIIEDDEAGETRYSWSTINPAWIETWTEQGPLQGVHRGVPIFGPGQTHERYHEATHRCTITFIADLEGIIRKWEMHGESCAWDVRRPKK